MAKNIRARRYSQAMAIPEIVNEPLQHYLHGSVKKVTLVADFTYKKFEKISSKIPFTQKDWASILHLSERTLQRYAKNNTCFEGIYVDRLLHIDELIQVGLLAFATPTAFYTWLKKDKVVLGKKMGFEVLHTTTGIDETIKQLNRILHGVYT